MFKKLARWILREDLAQERREAASHFATVNNEVLRLTKILKAKDSWWQLCELLTSPRDVALAKEAAAQRWEMARAEFQNMPGAPQVREDLSIQLIHKAMRDAMLGLLQGIDVRFSFQVNPENRSHTVMASVFVDRAQFHVAAPLERARYQS